MAIDFAIVFGICGTSVSPPLSTSRVIGAHPAACAPYNRGVSCLHETRVANFAERLVQLREQRAASHRDDHSARESPAQLLGDLEAHRLRALAIVAAQIHVHDSPSEPIGELRAQTIHIIIVAAHPHEMRPVHRGAEHLRLLEIVRNEDPRRQPCARGLRRNRVREIAGGRAADRVEAERLRSVDRRGDDAILERQRWMRHRVVLDPELATPSLSASRGASTSGVKPVSCESVGVALEGEPLAITPHRVRARRDLRAARQPARGRIHRLERAKARSADRFRRGLELCAAHLAVLRKRAQRDDEVMPRRVRAALQYACRSLVFRDGGIDIVAPARDAAGEIPHLSESGCLQLLHGLRAAPADLAVHDNVTRAVERRQRLDERAERDEPRAGNARNVPLVRLANIDEIEVVAARDPLRELRRRDLGNRARRGRIRSRSLTHAAELLVVDELRDLVRAARGALGILAQVERAEAHAKRIDQQQSSGRASRRFRG